MVKTIVFDLGGVIMTINHSKAVERFKEIGLTDAEKHLDPYTQKGIFGDLECGRIDADTFRTELSKLAGKEITHDECLYAWKGYCEDVPKRNLNALRKLRAEGYRVVLLSNTNPFIMSWAMSGDFDGEGHSLADYMDACYLSYKYRMMKPDEQLFRKVLMEEHSAPADMLFVDDGPRNVATASEVGYHTYCPENGSDWTEEIYKYIR